MKIDSFRIYIGNRDIKLGDRAPFADISAAGACGRERCRLRRLSGGMGQTNGVVWLFPVYERFITSLTVYG